MNFFSNFLTSFSIKFFWISFSCQKSGVFEKKIRPVLVENCYKCHSAEAEQNGKLKGKLRLDLREGTLGKGESGLVSVVPGNPDKSNLYRAITYLDSELVMPPKNRLPMSIIADFKRWIEMGAPDPRDGKLAKAEAKPTNLEEARKFWSFQTPIEPKTRDQNALRSERKPAKICMCLCIVSSSIVLHYIALHRVVCICMVLYCIVLC